MEQINIVAALENEFEEFCSQKKISGKEKEKLKERLDYLISKGRFESGKLLE